MNDIAHFYSHNGRFQQPDRTRVLEEIAYLEARLIAIGGNGDCAYERSLAQSYHEILDNRRRQLAQMKREVN